MKYLLVETDKIISNIELIRQTAGDSQLIAVLKANAYGLGLREIYPVLRQCGVRKLAVTEPEDALTLRELGAEDEEILVLRSTACTEDIEKIFAACASLRFLPTISLRLTLLAAESPLLSSRSTAGL